MSDECAVVVPGFRVLWFRLWSLQGLGFRVPGTLAQPCPSVSAETEKAADNSEGGARGAASEEDGEQRHPREV